MSKIKLEVGKTYLNRVGEKVKILKKDDTPPFQYLGEGGYYYTESGKWHPDFKEFPADLIEEVAETQHTFALVPEALTATRYTFTIPDGATRLTVEQVSNRIIVEMVPEKEPKPGDVKFKEGDIVFEDGRIMIIEKYPNLYRALIHGSPDRLHVNGSYGIPFTSEAFRLATAEEAQLLFDALKKAGKRWNQETLQMEDMPERERIMDYLQGYGNNGTWNDDQLCSLIECYLKHKESEQ